MPYYFVDDESRVTIWSSKRGGEREKKHTGYFM